MPTTFFEEKHFEKFTFGELLSMRYSWYYEQIDTKVMKDKKQLVYAIISKTREPEWHDIMTYELKEEMGLYNEITVDEKNAYNLECADLDY